MKKGRMVWIFLMACLYLAGCENTGREQEASVQDMSQNAPNITQETQAAKAVWNGSAEGTKEDADKDLGTMANTGGTETEAEGRQVEFLGAEGSILQECFVYYGGEKEEIPLSKAEGLVKMVSEFMDEMKTDCESILSDFYLNGLEGLEDISKKDGGTYYMCFRFAQPPSCHITYGKQPAEFENASDIFIIEVDNKGWDFTVDFNVDDSRDEIVFGQVGTPGAQGKQDKILDFLEKYDEWKAEEQL